MKQPIRKEKENSLRVNFEDVKTLIVNQGDMTDEEAINLAFIYLAMLACGDQNGPIDVTMVNDFLENVLKEKNLKLYEDAKAFYRMDNKIFSGDSEITEKAIVKAERKQEVLFSNFNRYRTLENAYRYSKTIHEAIDAMAPKLDAPEDMDNVTRAKWLWLWIVIFKDQSFFWFDYQEDGKINFQNFTTFNSYYFMPESLIRINREYFAEMQDGNVILEQMQALINLYPERVQESVLRFGELKENVADSSRASTIREGIKKQFFPVQWSSPSEFFMTKEGIKSLVEQILMQAIDAYNNGGISSLKVVTRRVYNPYQKLTLQNSTGYIMGEYNNGVSSRQTCVTSENELAMYVEVYRWLTLNPDFKFGSEEKTLAEYGLCGKLKADLPDFKECVATWILEMGFANSEDDINWDMVQKIICEEKYADIMQDYFAGKIDANEIFSRIGFKSDNQAIACFSKKAKLAKSESNNIGPALKRVKTFGKERSLTSDIIYLALFQYLVEFKPEVLSNQMIRQYASAF
jgi:hypothetical protein